MIIGGLHAGALAQHVFEGRRPAMLLEQIAERLLGKFLNGFHAMERELVAQGRVIPVMSDVTQLLAASPILKAVAVGLFRPKGQKFQVTAKGGDRSKRFVQWPVLNNFPRLFGAHDRRRGVAFLVEDGTKLRDSSALCLFWSWCNILILTLACVVCVEQPRLRGSERVAARDQAELRIGDDVCRFDVRDISLTGMRLAKLRANSPAVARTILAGTDTSAIVILTAVPSAPGAGPVRSTAQ